MNVTVKGTVLEKFSKQSRNKDGVAQEKMYVRLYQEGQRMNLDVNVSANTYAEIEKGQVIELDNISLNTFKDVIYAREQWNQ